MTETLAIERSHPKRGEPRRKTVPKSVTELVTTSVPEPVTESVTKSAIKSVTVVGAGITGLWAALTLARRGHGVTLIEAAAEPFALAASRYAGAMLAPYCEAEGAEPVVQELGLRSLDIWRQTFPGVIGQGTLVLAQARDRAELSRFAQMTQGHALVDGAQIGALEPDLADRFAGGLYFANEAHMAPWPALHFLLEQVRAAGATVSLGQTWTKAALQRSGKQRAADFVVDCRGLAARGDQPQLRGVRGERAIIKSHDLRLRRPVRLLHPRFPLYVVPWGDGTYMVGATVIESEAAGPVSVRSALELLGMAYALHPAFGEAEIVELAAGVRPAYPDNVPRIAVDGRHICVNGLYRHGFLMAPALGRLIADFIETGRVHDRIFC